jgi:hypothetical protein
MASRFTIHIEGLLEVLADSGDTMVAPSLSSDKPAVKSRRHVPLLVGVLIAAVVAGGYLAWQHFAHNHRTAVAEAPPPIPAIAATVQKQNLPIVLTGIGNVAALNSATGKASSRRSSIREIVRLIVSAERAWQPVPA